MSFDAHANFAYSTVAVPPTIQPAFTRVTKPLLSPTQTWENGVVEEPNALYESATWKMWYSGGWNSSAMGYATCTGDPTVTANWTKYVSNPVLGQGGSGVAGFVSGINVVKVGTTYYTYYYDTVGGGNLKVSTSSDGIAWGTPSTAIASNAQAGISGWANTFVWNEGGTTWKMLVEGKSTGTGVPWLPFYATSTDGLSWTIVAGPLTSLKPAGTASYGQGPWLARGGATIGGRYYLWFHAGVAPNSDIYEAWSTDAQNWTITGVILTHDGSTYEKDQVADASVVENSGTTYLFYDGVNNAAPAGYINVATFSGSLDTTGALSVQAGDGTLFPTAPFNATVWPAGTIPLATNAEIVRVTNKSTDQFTFSRSQEGSSLRTIIAGDQFAATITKKTLTDIETGTSETVGGDLSGTLPNPTVAKINGTTLATLSDAVNADRLRWDGSSSRWDNSALIWRPLMTLDPSSGNYVVVTAGGDAVMVEA